MNFQQSFKMAISSILGSKMRSFLTMLGIIIGVGSVIILISLMNGMTKEMTSSFESMGANTLNVSIMGRGGNRVFTEEHLAELAEENPEYIQDYSPMVTASVTAKYGSTSLDTTVTGVNEVYPDIRSAEVDYGRFLQYIDVENGQNVCVIGTYQMEELFGGQNPVGEEIKFNGINYTVVGVTEEVADSEEGSSDDIIYVPYSSAAKLSGNSSISSFIISAVSTEETDIAITMALIEQALTDVYEDEAAFRITSMSEMIDSIGEITGQMSMVLVGIAGISLLVGGIGIMNIMLVSVTERIREIGIKKSLGAKRKVILQQFLIESATTGGLGGVIGIVFGIGTSYIVGNIIDIPAAPTFFSVALAFSVSVAIGIIFGYFPANKAAKLNPIEALRHD